MDENNKLDQVIEFLNEHIAEVTEYANSKEYSGLDQHDCRIAAEAYELVLNFVQDLKTK